MQQTNQSQEYNRLYERYNKMSDEELSNIIKPENGYTKIAIKVAYDILQSDRSEYYKNIEKRQKAIEDSEKIDYDDIVFDLSKDIHSIKNMLLFFVVLTILGLLFGIYSVFVTLPKLF